MICIHPACSSVKLYIIFQSFKEFIDFVMIHDEIFIDDYIHNVRESKDVIFL
jgi:hypothetical protein